MENTKVKHYVAWSDQKGNTNAQWFHNIKYAEELYERLKKDNDLKDVHLLKVIK